MTAARLGEPDARFKRLLHGVKYKDGEFLLRCGACWKAHAPCYWPLTLEFWNPNQGLTRCRACWSADNRIRGKRRERETRADWHRRYYSEAHDVILFKKREHYYANREAILARRRELYALRRAGAEIAKPKGEVLDNGGVSQPNTEDFTVSLADSSAAA